MTNLRTLGRLPKRAIGEPTGAEKLMNVEISVIITRTEQRIEDHLRYIQENSHDQAVQKVANVHLTQMLFRLKRLENYRDAFRQPDRGHDDRTDNAQNRELPASLRTCRR